MGSHVAAVEGIVSLLVVGMVLAVLGRNRAAFSRHLRLMAVVAVVVGLLSLPEQVVRAWFVDPGVLLGGTGLLGPWPDSLVREGALLGLVAGLVLLVLRSAWCALQAGAAAGEWARIAPGRPLFGLQEPSRWRRLAAALALGAALGAVSAPLFHFLGVESGPDLERLAQAFPGLAAQPPLVRTLLAVSVGCAAAVTEEITFRGALLGFFLALAGQRWWGPALAGLLTAGIWASMHLGMTTAPLLKAGQITVLGLLLAEVARRRGLGAAVAIHLGVNLTGAIMAPLVLPLSAP